jgi:predicted NodU family carbamoyl transferase
LLNTSLNIKGMPMVNDIKDGKLWTHKYKVKVL